MKKFDQARREFKQRNLVHLNAPKSGAGKHTDRKKQMKQGVVKHKGQMYEAARIPRKAGQPAKSDKHSDLYTDEDPKGTIHGLKFATTEDAKRSVRKIKSSGRAHAHKIQAAIAMEQRARVMGKKAEAAVYREYINKMKKKTKEKNEERSWSDKYKKSIDCDNPKGFSQRAHCAGRNKREGVTMESFKRYIEEKNKPTNPELWSQAKAKARAKFDVYPSAYANAWASKWYKSKGGGWRKTSEEVQESYDWSFLEEEGLPIMEAEYQGKTVKLNDPIRTSEVPTKKFKVYVKDGDKVKVVRFGDPNMDIKRDDPNRRKNFRARHNCDNPGPKTKARYWSCIQWRASAKVDN